MVVVRSVHVLTQLPEISCRVHWGMGESDCRKSHGNSQHRIASRHHHFEFPGGSRQCPLHTGTAGPSLIVPRLARWREARTPLQQEMANPDLAADWPFPQGHQGNGGNILDTEEGPCSLLGLATGQAKHAVSDREEDFLSDA